MEIKRKNCYSNPLQVNAFQENISSVNFLAETRRLEHMRMIFLGATFEHVMDLRPNLNEGGAKVGHFLNRRLCRCESKGE